MYIYTLHTPPDATEDSVLAYCLRRVVLASCPQLSLSFPGKALKQLTYSFYLSVITRCTGKLKPINILLLKTACLLLFLLSILSCYSGRQNTFPKPVPSALKQSVGLPLYSFSSSISTFITLLFSVSTQILIPRKYLSWIVFHQHQALYYLKTHKQWRVRQEVVTMHQFKAWTWTLSVIWTVWIWTMEKYCSVF